MTRPVPRKALSTAVILLLVASGVAGCIPPAAADGATSTVESDARGGSWTDTFDDRSGIDWGKSNNVTVANGTVSINGTYDAKTSNNGTWHLNEGTGTTAYDGSANGNNGTLKNGVSWTTGKYGSALKFDGSNDYVDLSHDKAFDMSGDLSIQLWVNKSTDVSYAGIVGRWDWNAYNLMLTNDGKKMRMEFMRGGTNYDTFDDTTTIPNGRWVHLAATFNDTADKLRFYVDGKLSSTHSASNSYDLTSTSGLVFGSQSPSISRYFAGSMDEIELFDTPLTDTEVNDSYKNGPYSSHNFGNITTKQITVPSGMRWDTLVINKTSGSDQVLNVTVLNSAGTRMIMGTSTYATGGEFDISSIDASKYPTIRLNATFEDNGIDSPLLHYWGVSWRASNAWRDTLFAGQKVTSSKDVQVQDGIVTLKAGSFPAGAVAVWQCNEGSGTKVGDGTTNGHNGTTQGGASWTTGKFGKALSLDGTDDYATVKDNDDFDFGTGQFTLLAWVKTTATTGTGSGRDDILVKGDPTISGYSLSARSNVATFFIANSGALYGTTSINDGNWHHIAGTRDSSGNTVLYLDGSSEATGSNNENVDTTYDVHLGRHGTKQESYFDGALDDMAVFNKALSSTAIKDIYKNGYGMVSDNGNVVSKPISVPAGKTWDKLYVNRTRPAGTTLNVTLIDASTNKVMQSYKDLTSTTVDLSSINPRNHPRLKLKADFSSDGKNNSVLHDWAVTFAQFTDSDNDGYGDNWDAFPNNPFEFRDIDGDGIGDTCDPDTDGDGTPNDRDAFPWHWQETKDTDGDGIGDGADKDDDNDGVPDANDVFPKNPTEYLDSDGDGIGDNLDPDDDGNGVDDDLDFITEVSGVLADLAGLIAAMETSAGTDVDSIGTSLAEVLVDLGAMSSAEVDSMNSTATADLDAMVAAATSELEAMGVSISDDVDGLEAWVAEAVAGIEALLAETNASLALRMAEVEERNEAFVQSLSEDLHQLSLLLDEFEEGVASSNEGTRARIAALSVMASDLSGSSLEELSALLTSLAEDITDYDEATATTIRAIAQRIQAFQAETASDMEDIDGTLEELAKLDSILAELEELETSLGQTEQDLDSSVKEVSDEQLSASSTNMTLLIVAVVLTVVVIVLVFRMQRRKRYY